MTNDPKLTYMNRRLVNIPDTTKILAAIQQDLGAAEADYEADPTLEKWNNLQFMRSKVQQYQDRLNARLR